MPYFLTAEKLIGKEEGDGPAIDESSMERPPFVPAQTSGWTVVEPTPVPANDWPTKHTVDMPGVGCSKPVLLQARTTPVRDWGQVREHLDPQCSRYREQVWAIVYHDRSGIDTIWVRVDLLGRADINNKEITTTKVKKKILATTPEGIKTSLTKDYKVERVTLKKSLLHRKSLWLTLARYHRDFVRTQLLMNCFYGHAHQSLAELTNRGYQDDLEFGPVTPKALRTDDENMPDRDDTMFPYPKYVLKTDTQHIINVLKSKGAYVEAKSN